MLTTRSAAHLGECLMIALVLSQSSSAQDLRSGEMAGYLLVGQERAPEDFGGGFSMYVAAWPLVREYPGNQFQTGLFGTWMFARQDAPPPEEVYSDIEGGLGWWRDTRFATETPKFIMGGVALNFVEWANGPGAGKGRDWDNPTGLYGVAQLSSRLLWPPDGLNLAQGTCGELFGYGYLPLPLAEPKSETAGADIPTGDNCWTLFLNTTNFKGPVAFFTPVFWSRPTVENPHLAGLFLDARPSDPNRALQMETQHIPSVQVVDGQAETWARIAPTSFPLSPGGDSELVHGITSYSKAALWDGVKAWFEGGPPASGAVDYAQAWTHRFTGQGGATWRIYTPDVPQEERAPVAWSSFATPAAIDGETFGYQWDRGFVTETRTEDGLLATLPEFYHLVRDDNGRPVWVPVRPEEVPAETGLGQATFGRPASSPAEPYVTPESAESCWGTPGPVAGPFRAELGDGSVLTYSWYRFADQPALLNADLTDAERETMQVRVEMLHREWSIDRDYLAPPARGTLAGLDPALIVSPPPGLDVGYVPIVTRQEAGER